MTSGAFKQIINKMFMRIRLLTILILVASVAFMVRIGDAVISVKSLSGELHAEEEKTAEKITKESDKSDKSDKKVETAKEETKSSSKEVADKKINLPDPANIEGKKLPTDSVDDEDYPEIKKEMYQDLVKRRQELDNREKNLAQREALLDASKKEIDHKYKELVSLRDEIQGLLKQQTDAENARIDSLVKIYTGMKPKDAARIFNTLDMDVLISVVGRMPESRAAIIIASMDADPARALTTMLAEQKKLPDLP